MVMSQGQATSLVFERLHARVRAQTEGFKGLAPYVSEIMKDIGATSVTLHLLKEGLKGTSGQGTLTHSFTIRDEEGKLTIHSTGSDIDLGSKTSFIPSVYALSNGLRFLKVDGEGLRTYSTAISDQSGNVFPLPMPLDEQIVAPLYIKDKNLQPNRLGVLSFSGNNLMLDILRNTGMDSVEQTRLTMLYLSMLSSGISTIISSRIDQLTTLPRRGEFDIMLRAAIDLFESKKLADISVALLDIDHFKAVNDMHGHLNGDIVLQQVASISSTALRNKATQIGQEKRNNTDETNVQDFFARWGGEEFISLIVSGPEGARIAAERIRKKIEETTFNLSNGKSIKVTVSIGVASLTEIIKQDVETVIELVERITKAADAALYEAKAGGRNQTRVYAQG